MHKEDQKSILDKKSKRPREVNPEPKGDDRGTQTERIVTLLEKILEHLERMERERKGL